MSEFDYDLIDFDLGCSICVKTGAIQGPLLAIYTFGAYWVFRGKVRGGYR